MNFCPGVGELIRTGIGAPARLCGYTGGDKEDWQSIRGCHRSNVTCASQQQCPAPAWRHLAVSDAIRRKMFTSIVIVFNSLFKSSTNYVFCTRCVRDLDNIVDKILPNRAL
jgi:hypothetical protein